MLSEILYDWTNLDCLDCDLTVALPAIESVAIQMRDFNATSSG